MRAGWVIAPVRHPSAVKTSVTECIRREGVDSVHRMVTLALLLPLRDIVRDRPRGVETCPIDVATAVVTAGIAWIEALLKEAKTGAEMRKAMDARTATVVDTGCRVMTPTNLSGEIAHVEAPPTDAAVALAGARAGAGAGAQNLALVLIEAEAEAATITERDTRVTTLDGIPAKASHQAIAVGFRGNWKIEGTTRRQHVGGLEVVPSKAPCPATARGGNGRRPPGETLIHQGVATAATGRAIGVHNAIL